MASLITFLKRTSFSSSSSLSYSYAIACHHPVMFRRLFTTTTPTTTVHSLSFAQRIRDLPKDLPGTNIKKHVSHVTSLSLSRQHATLFANWSLCFALLFMFLFTVHSYHATCTTNISLYPTSSPSIGIKFCCIGYKNVLNSCYR